jgi:hypothetical protein
MVTQTAERQLDMTENMEALRFLQSIQFSNGYPITLAQYATLRSENQQLRRELIASNVVKAELVVMIANMRAESAGGGCGGRKAVRCPNDKEVSIFATYALTHFQDTYIDCVIVEPSSDSQVKWSEGGSCPILSGWPQRMVFCKRSFISIENCFPLASAVNPNSTVLL